MARQHLRPLGDLELAVMEVVWARSAPTTVKDVAIALGGRDLAYTTVMTTLDRLFKKGLLEREKRSHAYVYRPAVSRSGYERHLVSDLLEGLNGASREALLAGFLDFASADPAGLDALERLLAERRKQGR